MENHLGNMKQFFNTLIEYRLTVSFAKSEFCHGTLTFLGHVVGQAQVRPVPAKVQTIYDYPVPTSEYDLMRSLGMAGYYRKFCRNFSTTSVPLTNFLKKNIKVCTQSCQEAFDKLKAILKRVPALAVPDVLKPFKLAVDASDVGAGGVLLQEDEIGVDHPVCYFSKKFSKMSEKLLHYRKKCLFLIISFQNFEVHISSLSSLLTVYTDHNPLIFLRNKKNTKQRLLR